MLEAKLTLVVILVGLAMSTFCVMIIAKTCQAFRRDLLKRMNLRNNLLAGEVERYRAQVNALKTQLNQLKSESAGLERELSRIPADPPANRNKAA